jgi:hypothetical protein
MNQYQFLKETQEQYKNELSKLNEKYKQQLSKIDNLSEMIEIRNLPKIYFPDDYLYLYHDLDGYNGIVEFFGQSDEGNLTKEDVAEETYYLNPDYYDIRNDFIYLYYNDDHYMHEYIYPKNKFIDLTKGEIND